MTRYSMRMVIPALFAVGGVLLTGCGGGGGDDKKNSNSNVQPTRAALIGTWCYQSLKQTGGGAAVSCPGGYPNAAGGGYIAYCGAGDLLVLNDNDTYSSSVTKTDGVTLSNTTGTWSLSGSDLTLRKGSSNAAIVVTTSVSMSADRKSFTLNAPDLKTTLTRQ